MPVLSGLEVCEKVRNIYEAMEELCAESSEKGIKIVKPLICYLTQYERQTMIKFIKEGERADLFLEKPIPLSDLKSFLKLLNIL